MPCIVPLPLSSNVFRGVVAASPPLAWRVLPAYCCPSLHISSLFSGFALAFSTFLTSPSLLVSPAISASLALISDFRSFCYLFLFLFHSFFFPFPSLSHFFVLLFLSCSSLLWLLCISKRLIFGIRRSGALVCIRRFIAPLFCRYRVAAFFAPSTLLPPLSDTIIINLVLHLFTHSRGFGSNWVGLSSLYFSFVCLLGI